MDLGLKEKSVIVTGGGSNIGRAIVLEFASEGANITIGDIDIKQAHQTAELARSAGAGFVNVVKTDVTNLEQVREMFDVAASKFGGVDCLINNVGWDKLMYFTQTDPAFWQKVFEINFVGTLNCTRAALDLMVPKRAGSIVSIGSDASRQGEPREAVYGGMKAAVSSFMKTIARENGRYGIRCNVVCPGITVPKTHEEVGETSMWADTDGVFTAAQLEKVAKALPLKKIGRPEDIASAVVFLSSSRSSYITGQVLSVSGGYSMVG